MLWTWGAALPRLLQLLLPGVSVALTPARLLSGLQGVLVLVASLVGLALLVPSQRSAPGTEDCGPVHGRAGCIGTANPLLAL